MPPLTARPVSAQIPALGAPGASGSLQFIEISLRIRLKAAVSRFSSEARTSPELARLPGNVTALRANEMIVGIRVTRSSGMPQSSEDIDFRSGWNLQLGVGVTTSRLRFSVA